MNRIGCPCQLCHIGSYITKQKLVWCVSFLWYFPRYILFSVEWKLFLGEMRGLQLESNRHISTLGYEQTRNFYHNVFGKLIYRWVDFFYFLFIGFVIVLLYLYFSLCIAVYSRLYNRFCFYKLFCVQFLPRIIRKTCKNR